MFGFFFWASVFSYAQTMNHNEGLNWFVSSGIGYQMSGIKSEDFIRSNYSPLLQVTTGKWFTPYLALQIGYKGFYFNTISDDIKHHYSFYYGEAVLNLNQLITKQAETKKWSIYLHAGSGYFYNYNYGRPNICANLGIQNNYILTKNLLANFDIAAILGWDIYQGDEDILPGITIGITYLF